MSRIVIPPYPRTPHLPHNPNATDDDIIAKSDDILSLFSEVSCITEKVDGSNLGMSWVDGYPAIRNKSHFFNKGHIGKNASAIQYHPVFNWAHEHQDNFEMLDLHFEYPPVVYGEWMYMTHGILYDALPDLFVAFALWSDRDFIPTVKAREILVECGFTVVPLLFEGIIKNYKQLEKLCQGNSDWVISGDRRREGIYINCGENRFKMVRPDFVQGKYFGSELIKNKVIK